MKLVALMPLDKWPRTDVKAHVILAYTIFGEAFSKFGQKFPPMEEHFRLSNMFWSLSGKLLAEGKIKPHPVALGAGGLQGVPAGRL